MKNLLTKTLFISLLLSAAMPSDAHIGSSTQDVNKFAEVVSTLGAAVIVGVVAVKARRVRSRAGAGAGAGVGEVIGSAAGAGVGSAIGEAIGRAVVKKMAAEVRAVIGAVIGETTGAAMRRKITERLATFVEEVRQIK